MKLAALTLLAAATVAQAYDGAYLTRFRQAGYVLPQDFYTEQCEIFADKIVIAYSTHDRTENSTRSFALPAEIFAHILVANAGEITQETGPVDGPTELYDATFVSDGSARAFDLGSRNGHSGQITRNSAPEAATLKEFLDQNCVR